jgi:DNA-binding response OmpR family regulator
VARVRAVLRRAGKSASSVSRVSYPGLDVDFLRHQVLVDGKLVSLTPTEFTLLSTLIRQPGRVFARSDLLDEVFGFDYEGLERTIDVHVMNLRKKIEPDPSAPIYVETVFGVGYRFSDAHDAA